MATYELLSETTWPDLSKLTRSHKSITAAISYVTTAHIRFQKGDVLVCDASDPAIKGRLTTRETLRAFHDDGAVLYSHQGLHAKTAIIDGKAFIGSANMSARAGTETREASLLTDNLQIAGLVLEFINRIKEDPKTQRIDAAFLDRIEKIEVDPPFAFPQTIAGGKGKESSKAVKKSGGASRIWFSSLAELTPRQMKLDENRINGLADRVVADLKKQKNKKAATLAKTLENDPSELLRARFRANSRLAKLAKRGDLILICNRTRGDKKNTVDTPATIMYAKKRGGYVDVCYAHIKEARDYPWSDVARKLKDLGVTRIGPTSTLELRDNEVEVLDVFK